MLKGADREDRPRCPAVALVRARASRIIALTAAVSLLEAAPQGTIRAQEISFQAAQFTPAGSPTVRLWATRIGLVGHTTANGHVVEDRDHFVALPSKRALSPNGSRDFSVQVSYRGRTALAPVWDVGPWNARDDFWNEPREQFPELPRWTPQAEASFFSNHNRGRDGFGRFVTVPASIDLADGTFWDDLGMTQSDWVDVTFLWMKAASPPMKPTPNVVAKAAPPIANAANGAVPRAASYNAIPPSHLLYLPLVMNDVGGWTTGWVVQNTAASTSVGTVELFDVMGQRKGVTTFSLPAFGMQTFVPNDVPGINAGFVGGAVIRSTGLVAAVVHEDRDGSDRAAYEAITVGSAVVAAPVVFKEYHGWSTGIQVQNLSNAAASIQITYTPAVGGAPWQEGAAIPAFGSQTFSQLASELLPAGFVGSAIIRSAAGAPLGVVVNELRSDGAAMAYPGAFGGTDRLQAPVLFKHSNGWDTGLQLFNLGPTTTAQVSYQGTTRTVADVGADTVVLPAGGSATLYQPSQAQLPEGFAGSASIVGTPGSRIVGIVNEVRTGTSVSMNYQVGQPTSGPLAAPILSKGDDGWDSGVQVLNGGSVATIVSVTFHDRSGTVVHRVDDALGPAVAKTYYLPAIEQIPAGFRGSALIQSPTGAPLSVIVNETWR